MLKNELELTVRFIETDAMGVVHHSNCYSWFEMGRFDFLEKFCEKSRDAIKWGDYYLPVIHIECDYKDFIKFGDKIVISTYLVKNECSKLCFVSEIRKKGCEKIAIIGYTEHVILNKEYKMMLSLPSFIKDDIVALAKEYPKYLITSNKKEGK